MPRSYLRSDICFLQLPAPRSHHTILSHLSALIASLDLPCAPSQGITCRTVHDRRARRMCLNHVRCPDAHASSRPCFHSSVIIPSGFIAPILSVSVALPFLSC